MKAASEAPGPFWLPVCLLPRWRVFDVFGYARQLRIGGRLLSRILRGANYFLDFCRLREALTALVMISPSVLPKA